MTNYDKAPWMPEAAEPAAKDLADKIDEDMVFNSGRLILNMEPQSFKYSRVGYPDRFDRFTDD